jgi:hypothetical protein
LAAAELTDPYQPGTTILLENSTRYKPDIAVDTADSASRAARNMGHILAAPLILSAIPVRGLIIIRIVRLRMNATSA